MTDIQSNSFPELTETDYAQFAEIMEIQDAGYEEAIAVINSENVDN